MSRYDAVVKMWQDWNVHTVDDLALRLDNFRILFAYNSGKLENAEINYHDTREIFENGKGIKVPMSAYETKGNRKKLTGAYSTKSPLVAAFYEEEPFNIVMVSDGKRAIMFSTKLIPVKPTRTAGGVTLFSLKKGQVIAAAFREADSPYDNIGKYRKIKLPATGSLLDEFDINAQQVKMDI